MSSDRLRGRQSTLAPVSTPDVLVVASLLETSVVVGLYSFYNDDDELAEVFNAGEALRNVRRAD